MHGGEEPDAKGSDAEGSDAEEPDGVQPDGAEPDGVEPDGVEPDGVESAGVESSHRADAVVRHPGDRASERPVTWAELAERAEQLGLGARGDAREMEARRVALSRYALVWWQGEAAESYRLRVHDRVNALAELAVALDELARVADVLADRARGRAEAEAVESLTGGPR